MSSSPALLGSPPAPVRAAVRDLLRSRPEFERLDASTRRELASGLVRICAASMSLGEESPRDAPALAQAATPARPAGSFARAQNAGSEFSGVSASRVAGTTQQILNAVSFP